MEVGTLLLGNDKNYSRVLNTRGGLNICGVRNISQYIINGGGVLISGWGGWNMSQYIISRGGRS